MKPQAFFGGKSQGQKVQQQAGGQTMSRAEIEARFNSVISNVVNQNREMMQQIEILRNQMREMHIIVESIVTVMTNKSLVLMEEFDKVREETKDKIANMLNEAYDRTHNLEIVDDEVKEGDTVFMSVTAVDTTSGLKLDDNRRFNLPITPDSMPGTQFKMLTKDCIGKRAGDKNTLTIAVPKEETTNAFAGMEASLSYEILAVKRTVSTEVADEQVLNETIG